MHLALQKALTVLTLWVLLLSPLQTFAAVNIIDVQVVVLPSGVPSYPGPAVPGEVHVGERFRIQVTADVDRDTSDSTNKVTSWGAGRVQIGAGTGFASFNNTALYTAPGAIESYSNDLNNPSAYFAANIGIGTYDVDLQLQQCTTTVNACANNATTTPTPTFHFPGKLVILGPIDQTLIFPQPADVSFNTNPSGWGQNVYAPTDATTNGPIVSVSQITYASNTTDVCTIVNNLTARVNMLKVGTCSITASKAAINSFGMAQYNAATSVTRSFQITGIPVTAAVTASPKVYDGTTTATLSCALVENPSGVTCSATGAFATKSAGTEKTVTITGVTLSGTNAAQYSVTSFNTTTTADITQKPLTVTTIAQSRAYNGTATTIVSSCSYGGLVSGDTVDPCIGMAAFNDKNAGITKPVQVTNLALSGPDSLNYAYNTTDSTTANIGKKTLTLTAVPDSKVYDGTTTSSQTPLVVNLQIGDTYTATQVFADKKAGVGKQLIPSVVVNDGNNGTNYQYQTSTASGTITPAPLTISGALVVPKIYDALLPATIDATNATLQGGIPLDTVSIDATHATGSFADKNVGSGKPVTTSGFALAGFDAPNYSVTQPSLTGTILARPVAVTAVSDTKTYDGTIASNGTPVLDTPLQGTDSFTTSQTFADKNVGTGKVLIPSITITDGNSGSNYAVTLHNITTGTITAKTLIPSAVSTPKVYDGTTSAQVTFNDDRITGDILTLSGDAVFTNKNVAPGKPVNITNITKSGPDANNYVLSTNTLATTGDIIPKVLVITATAANKIYDSLTNADVTLSTNKVAGDIVNTSYTTAIFVDKNVGTGKTVTVSGISISGIDASNYTFNTTTSTNADITAAPITVSFTAQNKPYDGSVAAIIDTRSVSPILGTDVVSAANGTAVFSDKNVGSSKNVTGSGFTLTGPDASNYSITKTNTTTADISKKGLTITITPTNKTYDGTAEAAVQYADDRVFGDALTISGPATFADKNAAVGKTVTASAITLTGADSGNYSYNTSATNLATILQRPLTVSAVGQSKVYDATTNATVTLSDDRVKGDTLTTSYTAAAFSDKNVSTGKTIDVTGISLIGVDATNYTPNTTTLTSADITSAPLTVSFSANNKSYDGSANASIGTRLIDPVLGKDDVSATGGTATFADKNAGTKKTVTGTGFTLSGSDASNYSITKTNTTEADITKKALTITARGVDKTYDGTATATVTFSDDRLTGDVFTISGTAAFADKNVGAGKTITITGISLAGIDALNYEPNTTTTTTASILKRALSLSFTANNKTYDGTTTATIATRTLSGIVTPDTVTAAGGDAAFTDATAGTGKTVTATGFTLDGTDASNYTIGKIGSTTADITGGGGGGYFGGTIAFSDSAGGSSSGSTRTGGSGGTTSTTQQTGTTLLIPATKKVAGETVFKFTKNMTRGSRITPDVSELQKRLKKEGFYNGPVTGTFGPLTRAAVIAYQKAKGIVPASGNVGPATRAVLNK